MHSIKNSDVRRGLDLSEELLQSKTLDDQEQRDLVYLQSVGYYKLGKVLEARRQLDELLKVSPNFRQAQTLKAAVEDQVRFLPTYPWVERFDRSYCCPTDVSHLCSCDLLDKGITVPASALQGTALKFHEILLN